MNFFTDEHIRNTLDISGPKFIVIFFHPRNATKLATGIHYLSLFFLTAVRNNFKTFPRLDSATYLHMLLHSLHKISLNLSIFLTFKNLISLKNKCLLTLTSHFIRTEIMKCIILFMHIHLLHNYALCLRLLH